MVKIYGVLRKIDHAFVSKEFSDVLHSAYDKPENRALYGPSQ